MVGIDVGTASVKCIIAYTDGVTGAPKIIGVGQAPTTGMRKGVVSHLNGPATAIDKALEEAERMSGHQVQQANLSINGSHILSTKSDGMIAVGATNHEVSADDVFRLEEVAMTGKVPANREILEIVPHSYKLDGQDNIKDPIGMTGTRLEIHANVVSALSPHVANLQKVAEMVKVEPEAIVPSVLASARAVLSESQVESGVAVIDFGASTTGVAVFEEGDLQYVGVVPMGSINVTNDLAIGLKVDPEIAEKVKLEHGGIGETAGSKVVEIKHGKETLKFKSEEIGEIIEARVEEIFELVAKELKKAGRAGKLPSGVVLVGGGSNLKGIVDFAKDELGVAARLGKATGFSGLSDKVEGLDFTAVIGLILSDDSDISRHQLTDGGQEKSSKSGGILRKIGGLISGVANKFR